MNTLMNTRITGFKKLILPAAIASLFLAGCTTLESPEGSAEVRNKLTLLQSDTELANRAPVAIQAAELSVQEAEQPVKDAQLARHRVFIADHQVDIAAALAESRLLEDQRKLLKEETANARLDSRTREAELARIDASSARNDAEVLRNEAYEARKETEVAQQETADAQQQTLLAQQQSDDLQQQVEALNAKATERGLVVTLGDVLFDTGRSELKGGSSAHLGKLAAFLNKYQDRTVVIEGHTDNVGSEDTNVRLSQRRADAVKSSLVNQGVAAGRVEAVGKGESYPVAGNDSVSGRQMNRRVEVIITNTAIATSTK